MRQEDGSAYQPVNFASFHGIRARAAFAVNKMCPPNDTKPISIRRAKDGLQFPIPKPTKKVK